VFIIIAVECNDSVYTERSGEIASADFPKPYPKSSDCMYRIELEEGFQITLEFDDTFDIEDHPEVTCPYDFIKVRIRAPLPPMAFKGIVYPTKINLLSKFTHPHVVSNLYEFFSSIEHKEDILKN